LTLSIICNERERERKKRKGRKIAQQHQALKQQKTQDFCQRQEQAPYLLGNSYTEG